jgi:hypothetical protein
MRLGFQNRLKIRGSCEFNPVRELRSRDFAVRSLWGDEVVTATVTANIADFRQPVANIAGKPARLTLRFPSRARDRC